MTEVRFDQHFLIDETIIKQLIKEQWILSYKNGETFYLNIKKKPEIEQFFHQYCKQ